jgi:hypothetical protein
MLIIIIIIISPLMSPLLGHRPPLWITHKANERGVTHEELDSPVVSVLGVRSGKLSNALNGQSWDG